MSTHVGPQALSTEESHRPSPLPAEQRSGVLAGTAAVTCRLLFVAVPEALRGSWFKLAYQATVAIAARAGDTALRVVGGRPEHEAISEQCPQLTLPQSRSAESALPIVVTIGPTTAPDATPDRHADGL